MLHGSLHHDADDAFWAAAQPARVRDVECRVLCREDALLQAVTQGREYSDTHPLRWAADAAELLRDAPAFDWDRVVEQARRAPAGARARRVARGARRGDGRARARRAFSRARARARGDEESGGDGPLTPTRAERVGDELRTWVRREVAPGERVTPRHAALWLKETWALPRARTIPRHALGRLHDPTPPGAVALRRGDALGFRHGEAGTRNLGAGWWAPDEHGTWSRGREAVLVLPLAEPDGEPYTVTLDLVPFLTPTQPHMEVEVAGSVWGFSGTTLADARRTMQVAAATRIALRFKIRHPISPIAARYDGDPRPLGIALRGLSLA